MEAYIGLLISFYILILGVMNKIFVGYMLVICWFLFALILYKKGYKIKKIAAISYNGGKRSFIILKMLFLLGAVISTWMASGTIPAIVYYCMNYITPHSFIFSAFLICCIMSFLIGTSLGTVSTVGIPLMILARNGNVNLSMTAGAIIAGALFGDRCSPMSASAAVVSNLTGTNIFKNIRNMLYSSAIPFLMSLIFYYIISTSHPLKAVNDNLSIELSKAFKINPIILLPAAVILLLSLFRTKTSVSMLLSILSASAVGMLYQNQDIKSIIHYMIWGYKMGGGPLQSIIAGGGILSMVKISMTVFISCSLVGIFDELRIFEKLKSTLLHMNPTGCKLFAITSAVSMVTAAFGCNQPIAVIMTNEIIKDCYEEAGKYNLALALENSAVMLSALIPWNTCALLPTTIMNVSTTGYIPYAFYLYVLPVTYFIYTFFQNRKSCDQITASHPICTKIH